LAIRRVIQKLRTAHRSSMDDVKKEIVEILEKELANCGPQSAKIKEEADAASATAEERLKVLEEQEAKRKEAAEKADELLTEFGGLITEAEEALKSLKEAAEPFEKGELTLKQVEATAAKSETAGEEARAKVKAAAAFGMEKNGDMKLAIITPPPPPVAGEEEKPAEKKPTLASLNAKLSEATRGTEATIRLAAVSKERATKKCGAKVKLDALKKIFTKYDKDKDLHLNKKEILAYAKGEFKLTLETAVVDNITKALVKEGEKGVSAEAFQCLKAVVGINREKALDAKRKEARLEREKELAEMKEKIQESAKEADKAATEAEEQIKKLEEAAKPLPTDAKTMKSTEMGTKADEVDGVAKEAKENLAEAMKLADGIAEDVEAELKSIAVAEVFKIKRRTAQFDGRITKCVLAVTKFRGETSKREAAELEKFRSDAVKALHFHQDAKKLNPEELFEVVDNDKDGKIDERDFQAFFKSCEKNTEAEAEGSALTKDDLTRLFASLCEDEESSISKDDFCCLARRYMKVVKETVVTDSMDIKDSKTLRRLEIGEVCEMAKSAIKEENSEVMRLHVRVLKDGIDGWVTPVGNQGTVFLEQGSLLMKVVKETILTPSFSIAPPKDAAKKVKDTTRKMKEGEILEVREWMKAEPESGLLRMKVKSRTDGQVGWATAVGNSGAVFLEIAA